MASHEEGVVVLDSPDALLTSFRSVTGDNWVVGSIHLRPEGYGPKLAALKEITATLQVIGPDSILIGGDFNSQPHLEASALATHIRGSVGWDRLGMKPVGDQSQPTHVLTRVGTVHSTSIDHCYVPGAFSLDVDRVLLPGVTGHKVQLVSARLQGTLEHPFGWKRYSWKKASEEVQDLQMAAVEIFWFWIWLAKGTPDNYLGAYHHLADQIVFKDPTAGREAFMELLRCDTKGTQLSWNGWENQYC